MPKILLCFPDGKHKALTMSYDDGTTADRRLVSIFNRHGIKGAFHLNGGLFGKGNRISEEEAVSLYEGQEVSAHTLTHPTIARCPREQLVHEIMEDRKKLERLAGYTVRGMSYPNGSFNQEIKRMLPYLGIEYARVVQTTGGFGMPDDWLEWQPTCHHNDRLLERAETFIDLHKSQYLYLMNVWGHSYEFDNDNNWELIESFCERISGHEDIWYATNIEIADYMRAYGQMKFSADLSFVYNTTATGVWLSVDGQIVEVKGGSQAVLA
ncbi:polysaccharide deacetylase family protein [Paenibacillus harenae]|uniref:Peptidoglycan/xylan/chitin deacetylase (PgdA/CDA1 family) n=1 Tax=Paenibacillus harenae TaxID=306543 RepID=A0ABT9U369_PAEHA|nr:polysaccharide deacetylase family protein [Paenibacillus harenae]MDQ0059269.1 peptidoglycan/xylan/chitin deacetylase (PgdA/CDA1 family) [Paenibacillus harenae]MDQ0112734.1 peptidoglycan/xylan/chitin deacetylase (PgdA/CDA1 family) [Paenibacillus harenae]